MKHYDIQAHVDRLADKILDGDSVGALISGSSMPTYFDLQDILNHYEPEVSDLEAVTGWLWSNLDEIRRCDQFEYEEYLAEIAFEDAA